MTNLPKPLLKLNKEIGSVEKAIAGLTRDLTSVQGKRERFLVKYIKDLKVLANVMWRFDVAHKSKLFAETGFAQLHELCAGMDKLRLGVEVFLDLTVEQLRFRDVYDLVRFVNHYGLEVRGHIQDLEGVKAECSRKLKELNTMESLISKEKHV